MMTERKAIEEELRNIEETILELYARKKKLLEITDRRKTNRRKKVRQEAFFSGRRDIVGASRRTTKIPTEKRSGEKERRKKIRRING